MVGAAPRLTADDKNRAGITVLVLSFATAALAFAAATVPPSSQAAPAPERRIVSTVLRYDTLLAEGYREQDMALLRSVADELQSEDEYLHMAAMGEGDIRLLPLLKQFEVVSVSVEQTAAVVETRETWDFMQEGLASRELVAGQRDLVYNLAWHLSMRADGSWYVTEIRALSASSALEPEQLVQPDPNNAVHP